MLQILLVAFGSAAGGLARWGLSILSTRWLGQSFPWGTFLINVTGCLFLGWFSTILTQRPSSEKVAWLQSDDLRLMVAVGFTGAYTTFATFELDADKLLCSGDNPKAFAYVFGSVAIGLFALRLGIWLAGEKVV